MPYADPERRKEYHKKYSQTYYPAHKEEYLERQRTEERKAYMKEYHRTYYETHKEKCQEQGRARYLKNRENVKARNRAWREKNPERYRQAQQAHAAKNKEKLKERSAAWYRENKSRARIATRRNKLRRYGLTPEAYESLLAAQNNLCLICRGILTDPAIDHDHKTGQVRGILCRICNAALGQLQDNPAILRRAADYLSNSSSGATSTPSSEPSTEPSTN